MKRQYYSPQLDRDLVAALYHKAKAHGVPMTKLASGIIRAALCGGEHGQRDDELRPAKLNGPLQIRFR